MIYTSYFAHLKNIPSTITPIAICMKSPDFCKLEYKKLAPSWSIYKEWKLLEDDNLYTLRFYEERLKPLDPQQVVTDLYNLANNNKDIVLLCYEKPLKFCHRHLVADWLSHRGFPCKELP